MYADGEIIDKYKEKPWYRISVELSIKDKDHLENFCRAIGLVPSKLIKQRDRYKKYNNKIKKYRMVYLRFRCKSMVKHLLNVGFPSSKIMNKSLPNFFEKTKRNKYDSFFLWKLSLAWLLGYYDGDGHSNSTRISSSSKEFLEEVKSKFHIKFKIKLRYDKGKKFRLDGIISKRPHWSLTLGASLFNEMIRNYPYSMQRKRRLFNERDMESFERLKKIVSNKESLQTLIDNNGMIFLIKKFNVSTNTFYQLCREWNVITPRMRNLNLNKTQIHSL